MYVDRVKETSSGETGKSVAQLLLKAEATTGEGAIWHPERKTLFWVDIEAKRVYEYEPGKKKYQSWLFDRMVSTIVPINKHRMAVALQNEIVELNPDTGKVKSIALINDKGGTVRCNEGKCDSEGRFWIGTIGLKNPEGAAVLYTVSLDGTVTTHLTGVSNSNGLVWSADKRFMYYNDSPTRKIARYHYDALTGQIRFDGIAVHLPEGTGIADGMTIDENGNLWVAQWGGYGVYCYNPQTGKLLTKIEVPTPNVPSCTFGGEELDILYITTARGDLSEEELNRFPDSGSIFYCKPGVRGVAANYFTR